MNEAPETVISVKVLPKSSRNEILGMAEGICKVKIKAPPVDGKANKALVKILADACALPKKNVEILSGWTSRLKKVRILGVTQEEFISLVSR